MQKTYADLEIGLHRRDIDSYSVELRFSHPQSDAEIRLAQDRVSQVNIAVDTLRALSADSEAYGKMLSAQLFSAEDVRAAFIQAQNTAAMLDLPLRVRLFIDPSAPELHSLHWETLRDPRDDVPLLMGERVLFSRYLSSTDWRPVRLRPWTKLRAVVVVANPLDGARHGLAPLAVEDELAQARESLGDIPFRVVATHGDVTLTNIGEQLRQGCDILYLVAHGARREGGFCLWLEDTEGNAQPVPVEDIVARFTELRQLPRLVVFAACQTAHIDERGVLVALGPRLAEIGVPAVLAMQADVSIQSARQFMPVFFRELQRDGCIDRAVAVARGVIRERSDWWMPVLFMRLRDGRIATPLPKVVAWWWSRIRLFGRWAPASTLVTLATLLLTAIILLLMPHSDPGWQAVPGGQVFVVQPVCSVSVEPFRIQVTEVTNADYRACVRAKQGCQVPKSLWIAAPEGPSYPQGQENYPVWGITWEDADAYCRFIQARLPTEAEWIQAARRGSIEPYPWGKGFDVAYANVFETGIGDVVDVRSYPQGCTDGGICDLIGNAREWISDRVNDPCDPRQGEGDHIAKGGSFQDSYLDTTIWTRFQADQQPYVGVRCARDQTP